MHVSRSQCGETLPVPGTRDRTRGFWEELAPCLASSNTNQQQAAARHAWDGGFFSPQEIEPIQEYGSLLDGVVTQYRGK